MDSRRFTRPQIAFAMGVPLAWAVLLWFHPDVPPDDVYGGLRDEVTTYIIVHVGTLVFIALLGVVLYMLVKDLPGRAARVARVAVIPFVVCYAAWETVIGLAVGALVQHANDSPASDRPAMADAIRSLGDTAIVGEAGVLVSVGALAWATAVIAAAVAFHGVGAPLMASVLLGLSAIVVSHPPPIGPIGLVCFAGAVAVLARSERVAATLPTPRPAAAGTPASA